MSFCQSRLKLLVVGSICVGILLFFVAFDQGVFETESEVVSNTENPKVMLEYDPSRTTSWPNLTPRREPLIVASQDKIPDLKPQAFRFIKTNPRLITGSDYARSFQGYTASQTMNNLPEPVKQTPDAAGAAVSPSQEFDETHARALWQTNHYPNPARVSPVLYPSNSYVETSRLTMAAAQTASDTANIPPPSVSAPPPPPPSASAPPPGANALDVPPPPPSRSKTIPPPAPTSPTNEKGNPPKTSSQSKNDEEQQSEPKSDSRTPEQIGVPPPRPQPEFLRDTSVLLEPGQYQFETGIAYTSITRDSVISQLREEQFLVANLRTVSRNLQVPLEFRVGLTKDMQGSISLPIGFANQTVSVANAADSADTWGIGDLSIGVTRVLYEGKKGAPNILGNMAIIAPTAETSFPAAQQAPGAALGNGFWVFNVGVNAVKTLDPIAIFGGMSYSYTFETRLPNGLLLDAGNIISYRLGIGYAINSRVALSGAFEGNYIGELMIDGRKLSGSVREPFSVRLAATIQSDSTLPTQSKMRRRKSSEPFVRFGLSDGAPDANFGIRWTY